jgi:hypothetical protein
LGGRRGKKSGSDGLSHVLVEERWEIGVDNVGRGRGRHQRIKVGLGKALARSGGTVVSFSSAISAMSASRTATLSLSGPAGRGIGILEGDRFGKPHEQ